LKKKLACSEKFSFSFSFCKILKNFLPFVSWIGDLILTTSGYLAWFRNLIKLLYLHPKPKDLAWSRLSGRSLVCCNIQVRLQVWSEMLTVFGNSWFSSKFMKVKRSLLITKNFGGKTLCLSGGWKAGPGKRNL